MPHPVAAAGGVMVVSRAVNGPDALTPACRLISVLDAQTQASKPRAATLQGIAAAVAP